MKYQIDAPKSLKKYLDDARSSYTRSHDAARDALATMMDFAQACFSNWEEFVEFCDLQMIRVRIGSADNDYIRVVRAVIGNPQLDKGGVIDAWISSDMVTSRYAKILMFADKAHNVITKEAFVKWLERNDKTGGGGTITDAYDRALTWEKSLPKNGSDGVGGDSEPPQDLRFDRGIEYLGSKIKEYVSGKIAKGGAVTVKIDLKKEGAPRPGLHRLLVQIADDGTVEYVGFAKPEADIAAEKEIRKLLPQPQGLRNTLPVLSSLITSTNMLRPDKTTQRFISIENKSSKFIANVYSGMPLCGPMITVEATAAAGDFPKGAYQLNEVTIDAIKALDRGLKFSDWSLRKHEGEHCFMVSPLFDMTVEELLEHIDESRKKPFEIPEGAYDTDEYCYVPLDDDGFEKEPISFVEERKDWSVISSDDPTTFIVNLSDLFSTKQKMIVATVQSSKLKIETTNGDPIETGSIKAPKTKSVKLPLFAKDVVGALKLMSSWAGLDGISLSLSPVAALFTAVVDGGKWKILIPARKGNGYDPTIYNG